MAIKGIDVSRYQGIIDWEKVKSDNVDFAFIRAGYSDNYTDPTFKQNIEGAKKAGLKVGVYHAAYALTKTEAEAEAKFLYNIIKDYNFDYPIAYDVEVKSLRALSTQSLTDIIISFVEKIKSFSNSYKVALYTNTDWRVSGEYDWNLIKNKFPDIYLWQAHYPYGIETPIDKIIAAKPKAIDGEVDIWQATDKGKVNGISGYVDINFDYSDLSNLSKISEATPESKPAETIPTSIYKNHVIDTKNELLTSGFRTSARPYHDGMDFVDKNGKQKTSGVYITAFADGIVTDTMVGQSIGTSVSIAHEGKMLTRYFHMKAGSVIVKVGQKVKKGDKLGIMGTTGDSTGIHLHFAIKEKSTAWNNGNYVNPEPYLKGEKEISNSAPAPIPTNSISVGNQVKIKSGAKTYDNKNLAPYVYNNTYEVYQSSGDRVVVGIKNSNDTFSITAAVNVKDLIKLR